MTKDEPKEKTGFFKAIRQSLSPLFSGQSKEDKARLEAFLTAVPSEYCGWMTDGGLAYSPGFATLLGLEDLEDIHDIQAALDPGDAAALEGLFDRLRNNGEMFCLNVKTADQDVHLQLNGTRGRDETGLLSYDILWLTDITDLQTKAGTIEKELDAVEIQKDRLQSAFDLLSSPTWLRNLYGEITWCNRAYADMADTSTASVISDQIELTLRPVVKKEDLDRDDLTSKNLGKELAIEAMQKKQSQTSIAHITLSGKRHLVLVKETVMPGATNTLGKLVDISREDELQQEKARNVSAHKELLEQLAAAVAIFGIDQKLEFYNSAFGQLWQLDESYLNKSPKLGDIMENLREGRKLPEQTDFRSFKQSWIDMFTSLIDPHEEMLYLPDGSALRMLVVPHPMGGLMMIFEDVTSRLELESSYNTLIAVQKETLDNLTEGVVVYGGDGRVKLWNPSFANIWTLNPEDLEGDPHVTRIVEKMKPRIGDKNWESVKEDLLAQSLSRSPRDGRLTLSKGEIIEYSTMPLPDGRVLVTQVDVTDTVRVEHALRERNAALEAAEQIKADFLSNVSYQLRTPLNAIMGFAEILAQEYFGDLNDKQKEYTDGIQEAGQRLIHLIDDILDLTSIEAGTMEFEFEEFNIHDTIQSMFDLVHDWARKEDIDYKLVLGKKDIVIKADQRRVKQILINLLRNAITHTPEGGTITLKTKTEGDNAVIDVIDTGSGISEEDQKRIFAPFERAKDSLRMSAGLGLSLVKNIIDLHEGEISIDSKRGKGTIVSFSIPLAKAASTSKPKTAQKKTTTKKTDAKSPAKKSDKSTAKKPAKTKKAASAKPTKGKPDLKVVK